MLFREVIALYCENLTKRSQVRLFSYSVLKFIQFNVCVTVHHI